MLKRIKKAEEYANLHLETATKLINMRKFFGYRPPALDILRKEFFELEALSGRKFQLASNVATIKDVGLAESLQQLANIVSNEYARVMDSYTLVIQGNYQPPNSEGEIKEVKDFLIKAKSFHAQVIERLDQAGIT